MTINRSEGPDSQQQIRGGRNEKAAGVESGGLRKAGEVWFTIFRERAACIEDTGLGLSDFAGLEVLLLKGPLAQGYRTNLWTTARIAALIGSEFGVSYHPDHIGRLMHDLGWTPQKPERRALHPTDEDLSVGTPALERNEEEIERWKQKEWPRIKKTPQGWASTSFLPMNRASC